MLKGREKRTTARVLQLRRELPGQNHSPATWFNYTGESTGKGLQTPGDIVRSKDPLINPETALLPPVFHGGVYDRVLILDPETVCELVPRPFYTWVISSRVTIADRAISTKARFGSRAGPILQSVSLTGNSAVGRSAEP